MDITNNRTRAEELIEQNRQKQSKSEEYWRKKGVLSAVPEITNRMARSVSNERREIMELQMQAGEYREQGSSSGFYSSQDRDPSKIRMVQTQAGVVSSSASLFKTGTASGNVTSSTSSGWRGSNDTGRQMPEVYSPLWLNSNLNLPRDRPTINAWSRSFFALNPFVHNAITLHSTYPIAKLNIKCKNPKIEKFFGEMIDEIDLMNIAVMAAQEYWVLGEAFIYGDLDESAGKWSRLMILNPDYVNVQRNVIAAEPIISLRPDENLRRVVNGNQQSDIIQRKQLDPSIVEHVRRNENIPLNNFYVHHMARRISPYEIRGTGLVVSVFRALMLFDKLRESKYAQADNLINPLTLVKIGNNDFRPTPVDLEHWRNVFEACHDEETEVLTDHGFVKFDEAIEITNLLEATSGTVARVVSSPKPGIKIACFNPENENLEYYTPSESHVYDYDGEMYHFSNDKMDIKVTPNHQMWVQRKWFKGSGKGRTYHWGDWEKTPAKEMKFFNRRFRSKLNWVGDDSIKTVKVAGKDVPIELYLEFLGYVLSEGCIYTNGKSQHTIGLNQTVIRKYGEDNTDKYFKMSNCMDAFAKYLGKTYSSRVFQDKDRGREIMWEGKICGWELFKHFVNEVNTNGKYKAKDKRIPRWVLGLSPRLLRILLDALVLGDGGVQSESGKFYYTSSKQLSNDVYEAAYKAGFVPTFFTRKQMFTIQWSETKLGEFPLVVKYSVDPRTKQKTEVVSKVPYKGKVWCFTVPTGLFITRRNGKITIQGNSQYDKNFKIFTHDAVTVEPIGFGSGIYDTSNDIQQLIKEIYVGLMVPSVIMDGSDTTYATGSVALDVLRQRYMQFRQMMTTWLKRKIFAPISQIQDFYEYEDGEKTLVVPDVDWNQMSLFDADSYINNMINLSQPGEQKRVSLQTLYRSLGLEYEEEQRKIRYENIQDAIQAREKLAMSRLPLHELKSLGPLDDIEETTDEPVPGQSPYVSPEAAQQMPGAAPPMGGLPSAPSLFSAGPKPGGAPPPAPIGGGGPKPPSAPPTPAP